MVALIFVLNRVVDRYLVAAVPFLAVAVGMWLTEAFEHRRIRGVRLAATLLVVCLIPGIAVARSLGRSNRGQLAKIQYVLDRSQRGDRMHDEWRVFNVFRPDMHYFWFMTRPGVRLYNGFTGGRFADYDACLPGGCAAEVRVRPCRPVGRLRVGRTLPANSVRRPAGTRPRVSGAAAYFAAGAGSDGTTGGRSLLMIWYSNFHCAPSFRRIQITLPRSRRSGPPAGLRLRLNVPAK